MSENKKVTNKQKENPRLEKDTFSGGDNMGRPDETRRSPYLDPSKEQFPKDNDPKENTPKDQPEKSDK